jgi:hypothetical protein
MRLVVGLRRVVHGLIDRLARLFVPAFSPFRRPADGLVG